MEIIPVVEQSLIIFSGLLLLALVVSYLLFKFNKASSETQKEQMLQQQYMTDSRFMSQEQYEEDPGQYYETYMPQSYMAMDYTSSGPVNFPSGAERHTGGPGSGRYKVVNRKSHEASSHLPERNEEFNYRFAPTKAKNAFAHFK